MSQNLALVAVQGVTNSGEGATRTSIALWIVAGLVVMLGMARLPLMPDRLWRFLCWSAAVVLVFYAAARIDAIPDGWIWLTWPSLLILVLALAFWAERLREDLADRGVEAAKESSVVATLPALTAPAQTPAPPAARARTPELSREPIFEEAPSELADMSAASLKELFADKTGAQGDVLTKQHHGKPVRVSGEVVRVELAPIPAATVSSVVSHLLFFDAEDYDAEPVLLALNKGDKIVVEGQIYKINDNSVALDRCKLVDARGRAS